VATQQSLPASRWRIRLVLVLLVTLVMPAVATVVYQFPPSEYSFYPPCLFHKLTGLHCPGCGATRCVGALVRGDLLQALAYNALLVLATPFILGWIFAVGYTLWTGRHLRLGQAPWWLIAAFIVTVVAFGVLRNLDVYPLNLLAPHQL
jgi:hypothetical protein